MWRCPVCEKENAEMQCSRCGFDGSCDYERYPSLGTISPGVDAIARRRDAIREEKKNILRCPSCGSGQFCFDMEMRNCICTECGFQFGYPENSVKKGRLKIQTAETESISAKKQFLFWQGCARSDPIAKNILVSREKVQKPKRELLETITLLLGWISIPGLLITRVPILLQNGVMRYVLILLLACMQIHLWKEGFFCPKWLQWMWEWWVIDGPKKGLTSWLCVLANMYIVMPIDILKFSYFLAVLGMGLFGVVGPFACVADLVYGKTNFVEFLSYVLFLNVCLYVPLWHIGNLMNRHEAK